MFSFCRCSRSWRRSLVMPSGGGYSPDGAANSAEARMVQQAAKTLVEAAVAGLQRLTEAAAAKEDEAEDAQSGDLLRCAQCESLLYEPTTLENGVTVCRPCVGRYREHLKLQKSAEEARKDHEKASWPTPSWAADPADIGFGKSINVVLVELTKRGSPDAYAAAAERQKANALFGERKFQEALEAYSAAIAGSPFPDVALHCNRSLTRVKLDDNAGALEDALHAVALSFTSAVKLGQAMWAKAWLRLGQSLLAAGGHKAEAAFALALSSAASPSQAPHALLLDLCKAMVDETTGKVEADEVQQWLREGRAPSLEAKLPHVGSASKRRMTMGVGELQQEEGELGSGKWVEEQLECALCLGLLFEPASISCGHTVCRPCLARTLDHAFDTQPACPMCRQDLSSYLTYLNGKASVAGRDRDLIGCHTAAQIPVNLKINSILQRHFAAQTAARQEQISAEESAANSTEDRIVVPIFICSLAVPWVACPLHIFEPRYRLMMRRCIESGQRQFGMMCSPRVEYGTMLRILEMEQLPDGRSRIQTIGTRRFRVLEWGEKDGYATGRIQWLDDTNDDAAEVDETTNMEGLEIPEEATPPLAGEPERKAPKREDPAGEDEEEKKPTVDANVKKLKELVTRLIANNRTQLTPSMLEDNFGLMPFTDGRDGRYCPAFVFWTIGFARGLGVISVQQAYALTFGGDMRQSPARRAALLLEQFEDRLKGRGMSNGSDDERSEEGD
eukprot:TRINITY_DN54913_c0_g1_i1.p1 TRINITY_DN54913_c0_g1~~TRINITY_DN54913_c0_g1_i1.p1  ORF type:complete len:731 (-),score=193.44 TRINITY_DN54913_c0_g1_i1:74-2266(-)